jgi:hypothetical protein
MKKITLSLGAVASCLLLIGILMKSLHWPGAAIIITVSVVLFAAFYSPLLLIDKNKFAQSGIQRFTNWCIMAAMSIISVAFLFKTLHWPGAGIGIYVGHIILLILIPIMYYRAANEKDEVKKLNFYNEAVMLVILTAFSLFIWLVVSVNQKMPLPPPPPLN